MKIILAVGTGSFIGGILRYLLSQFTQAKFVSNFPIGTLTVNIIGCFAIGVLFEICNKLNFAPEWRLFLITGILGGFTTFSAFSYETFNLFKEGYIFNAFAYVLSSVILGVTATFIGYLIMKLV